MGRLSKKFHHNAHGIGVEAAFTHNHLTNRHTGVNMSGDNAVDVIHNTVFHHHLTAGGDILLSRGKQNLHPAADLVTHIVEHPGSSQGLGRMDIVTASVHDTLMLRGVGIGAIFLHRQGIHIATNTDGKGLTLVNSSNNATLTELLSISNAHCIQLPLYNSGGLGQIKADFRHLM